MAIPPAGWPAGDRALPPATVPDGATYRLTIAYLGGGFAGWQRQRNGMSVQEVVETALERVVGEPVRLVGASRTDAGVHAAGQEAHLRLHRGWPPRVLAAGANHYLPDQVRVLRALAVAPDFHARAWALAKEYHYRMSRRPVLSPFAAPTTARIRGHLDVDAMNAAVALLEGRHDFGAFARSGGSHHQSWRRIFLAQLIENDLDLTLRVVGDGFLRGMVRALVGSLLWVAKGRLPLDRFAALLAGGARPDAGPSAPACGLMLMRVVYPDGLADASGGSGAATAGRDLL